MRGLIALPISLLILTFVLGVQKTAYGSSNKAPVNESDIHHQDGQCKSLNPDKFHLEDIGLTRHEIENNHVRCVMADFDGNGYYDFAFWGAFDEDAFWSAAPDSDARFELERLFKVIFFEKDKITGTQIIKNHARDHLFLYEPADKEGSFGEPKTELPGLVQWGEGGTTYIYLFDRKTGRLERSSYASE